MRSSVATINVLCLGLLLGVTACNTSDNSGSRPWEPPTGSIQLKISLETLDSCQDLEAYLRQVAREQMSRRLQESFQSALRLASGEEYCHYGYHYDAGMAMADGGVSAPSPEEEEGPEETSGTNNQVADVDEADLVKHDGKHIYLIASNTLRILASWPPEQTRVLSSVPVQGQPRKLFVRGDRLLVYSSVGGSYSGYECTYGYDCDFTGDGSATTISIFDIADRTSPKLLRQVHHSGSYIASRRVGDVVHTVISAPGPELPGQLDWPPELDQCELPDEGTIAQAFNALHADNLQAINTTPLNVILPTVTDEVVGQPAVDLLEGCPGFYRASATTGRQMTTLLSVDMTQQTPAHLSNIVSKPGAVYAAKDALFIAVREQKEGSSGWYGGYGDLSEMTLLHAFALDNTQARSAYAASGAVKGRGLNQFSMDVYEDRLRIATTTGHLPDPQTHNTVSVLAQNGTSLDVVGQLDQLAKGEDIRAVRFAGERGYVVTFKKTDPLFVLDLTDPAKPRVEGELKIPGFSTYMQPMDDQHVLALGYDADDQGSFAYFTGIQLQIFDVSDLSAPKLKHKTVIGTRGSSSEALTNHLAVTYFAPKNLLALPATICEAAGTDIWDTTMTFTGLLVFDVTTAAGFSERGRVSHALPDDDPYSMCGNWWTRASSTVRRSIIMDDYIFSLSERLLKVNKLNALATDLAQVSLQ
jgi:hypothetical protein